MKKIILFAIALLPFIAFAQKTFILNGNVKGLKTGDKIYLVYQGTSSNITDSTIVNDGSFSFKGEISAPAQGSLFKNKNPFVMEPAQGEILDGLPIYLEPVTFKVTGSDSLKNAVISGSTVNEDNKRLMLATKFITDELANINKEYEGYTDEQKQNKELIDGLKTRFEKKAAQMSPALLGFAKNNPKSYLSLVAVGQLTSDPEQILVAEKAYQNLSPDLKSTVLGLRLAETFIAGRKTAIGSMAMNFTQNDQNGKPVSLSDFKGKYVLIDFWASWCGPCRQENPNLVLAYQKYKDKGFDVLGVSLDQPGKRENWLKAVEADKLTWTQVSDLNGWKNAVALQYGIKSIPANFLIDPQGKIIATGLRGEELHSKLEELLNKKTK